ncbi:MAG: hypothetical protein KA752_11310 [Giesbergeria sp.]|nr:hypothetical protein [Giesbergeria sp.]
MGYREGRQSQKVLLISWQKVPPALAQPAPAAHFFIAKTSFGTQQANHWHTRRMAGLGQRIVIGLFFRSLHPRPGLCLHAGRAGAGAATGHGHLHENAQPLRACERASVRTWECANSANVQAAEMRNLRLHRDRFQRRCGTFRRPLPLLSLSKRPTAECKKSADANNTFPFAKRERSDGS